MKLVYSSTKDDSRIILTDFNCTPSQDVLQDNGLYKIIWARLQDRQIGIDGYNIVLKKGQMLFCTPLNILEVAQAGGLIALAFNREFYCIRDHDAEVSCNGFLFFGSSRPPLLTLYKKQLIRYDAMFIMLQEEFEMRDPIQGEMLRVLLKRLIITSSRIVKEQMSLSEIPDIQFDIVRNYHILVEKHFKTKHQVAEYADLLFKSPKTLSNLFKKMKVDSPLKVINNRLVVEAKRLLLYSDKNSEEVAYEIGFTNAGHFSKFFKRHTGHSPGSFKKSKGSL